MAVMSINNCSGLERVVASHHRWRSIGIRAGKTYFSRSTPCYSPCNQPSTAILSLSLSLDCNANTGGTETILRYSGIAEGIRAGFHNFWTLSAWETIVTGLRLGDSNKILINFSCRTRRGKVRSLKREFEWRKNSKFMHFGNVPRCLTSFIILSNTIVWSTFSSKRQMIAKKKLLLARNIYIYVELYAHIHRYVRLDVYREAYELRRFENHRSTTR